MQLSPALLKQVIEKKQYKWYNDRPNLIGIRTTLQVPDVFNDLFVICWKQEDMPDGLDLLKQQVWLNDFLYTGANGKSLKEDGVNGKNTTYALNQLNETVGYYRMKSYTITTDPGTYYLKHPLSKLGTAVLKPGQYKDTYQIGFHHGKREHPALIQTGGPVVVYRDYDLDNIAESSDRTESGFFGINIHRANASGTTPSVGKFSAGCQTFQRREDHDELMIIVNHYKDRTNNRFTYTLLLEEDLK